MKLKSGIKLFACIAIFNISQAHAAKPPKLAIVIVVDQFAQHYIQKLRPYFHYGLKNLLDNGIVYENAYVPHAMPATGTGHTGLNTGTFANYHGIIGNKWFNAFGNPIRCDNDSVNRAAVFSPNGFYDYGKSPRNIMVSGISDAFKRAELSQTKHHVFSLSLKSRAAIATSNKLGKAIWFDEATGFFTSSKAYFEKLPAWVSKFNDDAQINKLTQITWNLMYKKDDKAYQFHNTRNYTFASYPKSLINGPIPIGLMVNKDRPFELYMKTPQANQLIFDLAKRCIDEYVNKKKEDRMLLWIDISALDKLGHIFGPSSIESIDMIYHLDKQLEDIISYAQKHVGKDNALFALTADHGISFIPEQLKKEGLYHARRINIPIFKDQLNNLVAKKYGITDLIQNIKQPYIYFDQQQFKKISSKKQKQIIADLKIFLQKQPGIKSVWTYNELKHMSFTTNQLANYFKQQLFPDRSGQLIIQTFPYVIMTKQTTGASHKTPYEYNTHIPLILYQNDQYEKQTIIQKVWTLQLANTLAKILNTQKAPASTFDVLPGINKKD